MLRSSKLGKLIEAGTKVTAAAAVAALPLLALTGAGTAFAAVAHPATAAGPLNTCESGFSVLRDGNGQYINADGVNNPVTMGSDNTSCWKGHSGFGSYGEITDESGDALTYNSTLGDVVTEAPNGASYQEWEPGSWPNEDMNYASEWGVEHNGTAIYLQADGGVGALCNLGTGDTLTGDLEWFA